MRRGPLLVTFVLATAPAALAARSAQPTQPTEQPDAAGVPGRRLGPAPLADDGPLKVLVIEASGLARYRTSADQPWKMVAPGLEVEEGVEFSTGPKSFIRVQIGQTQQTTFDRLGTYAVTRAAIENGTIKTDTVMKYGRTRCQIDAAGREHDAAVRSATSTLAVRGTITELYDQPPFAVQAVSYTGRVEFRDARRQVKLGARGGRTVRLDADRNSAAETARASTIVDPTIPQARTPAEQRLIEQVIATGGVIGFDVPGGIPVVRGGTPLTFDVNSTNFPGEGLNFVLNWTGDANLNLTVALPAFGDLITPLTGLNRGKTGGVTSFDHRGGANGGFEIVYFPQNYPGSDCIDIPGPGNNPGTETYITSIDFVPGVVADVKLDTYVRDPVSGNKVLVQRQEGTINQSIGDVNFAPQLTTTTFVDDAVCGPAPASVARAAQRGAQLLTGRNQIDESCGGWQTLVAQDRARRAAEVANRARK